MADMNTDLRTPLIMDSAGAPELPAPAARSTANTKALTRQALQLAMRVLDLAEVYRKPHDMCQATAQVARCLKAMGDYASAEAFFKQAFGWTAQVHGVDAQVDLLCELAEVTCTLAETTAHDGDSRAWHAALERARDHAFEAAGLATRTADSHWQVKVLLRASDVLNRCGDHEDAANMQDRAITLLGLQPAEGLAEAAPDTVRAQPSNLLM